MEVVDACSVAGSFVRDDEVFCGSQTPKASKYLLTLARTSLEEEHQHSAAARKSADGAIEAGLRSLIGNQPSMRNAGLAARHADSYSRPH